MKLQVTILCSMIACVSAAQAGVAKAAPQSQTVTVSGVLVGPIVGPGGETTGLALYDHLNGNLISEVRDNTNSQGALVVDPCSHTYQPVKVTGYFAIENLGQFASSVKVLEAQAIEKDGPALSQDISSGIADGLCAAATGHEAFLKLVAAYPKNLTGVYMNGPCSVTVTRTDLSLTVQVQSARGGTQSCTLTDNDPMLTLHDNGFAPFFANGSPGTFATPQACGITTESARGQSIVFISTPDDQMASCTVSR